MEVEGEDSLDLRLWWAWHERSLHPWGALGPVGKMLLVLEQTDRKEPTALGAAGGSVGLV